MSKLNVLIALVVLGSSSVVAAQPVFKGSARVEINVGQERMRPRMPAVIVRDHRISGDAKYNEYEDRYDRRRHAPLTLDLTGEYSGTFGSVVLTQRGKMIYGSYAAGGGGTMQGKIRRDGRVEYTWANNNNGPRGRGVWYLNRRNNRIEGTWGTNESFTDGGAWNLVRQR